MELGTTNTFLLNNTIYEPTQGEVKTLMRTGSGGTEPELGMSYNYNEGGGKKSKWFQIRIETNLIHNGMHHTWYPRRVPLICCLSFGTRSHWTWRAVAL